MELIYNGVDHARFHPGPYARMQARKRLGIDGDDKTVVLYCPSRFESKKGVFYLLFATRELVERGFPIILLLGQPSLPDDIAKIAGSLGIRPRIILNPQPFKNQPESYWAADISVLPSLDESFGLPVIESMAAGVPVCASAVGAITELIQDKVSGLLVPSKDPMSLASAIETVINNDRLRRALHVGEERRAAQFSSEYMVASYRRMFSRVVEERHVARDGRCNN